MNVSMRAVYLTGDDFYLRAMLLADKDQAVAWFQSNLPIGADAAESFLKEAHDGGWDEENLYLAVVRTSDDQIIGSAKIEDQGHRTAWLDLWSAPSLEDAERLRARVLQVVIPWLRDEREILVTRVQFPADEALMKNAAERLGMTPAMRLREFVARPGHRVDLLGYQALNPHISIGEGNA